MSRIFRHIQGYWCIFSHIYRRPTRGRGEASLDVFENWKKVSWFLKKRPSLCPSLAKFSIQNVDLRVGGKTPPEIVFPVGTAYWDSCILRHYQGIFRLIQPYSGSCVALTYSQFCIISSIFRTGGLFKTLWNVDQPYSKPWYRALFSHIQALYNTCTHRNLAYSEFRKFAPPFYNWMQSKPCHINKN